MVRTVKGFAITLGIGIITTLFTAYFLARHLTSLLVLKITTRRLKFEIKNINFVSKFKNANIFSILIFILSVLFILFKGLNYGIDFKGGTLIELRTDKSIDASSIRDVLNSMDLGDVNVKKFGQEGDYLIKVEQKSEINNNIIQKLKKYYLII